ncbi:MAG TPA: hypothetical protein VGJ20_18125 [Xanthobacteraceae bacterium]
MSPRLYDAPIVLGLLTASAVPGFPAFAQTPQTPTLVQALTDHGVASAHANGTQKCVWQFNQPIGIGDTVVGYIHSADETDQNEMYPQSVTDDAGNTYNLSSGVHWVPFPEDVGIFYLTNIQGNPQTLTFDYTQYPASDGTILDFCDVGFAEYSGAASVTVVNPVLMPGTEPSITISPTAPALIWAFATPFASYAEDLSSLQNPGYSVIIDDFSTDNMGVWGSNSLVPAGQLTLQWFAPLGNQNPCDGSTYNGCPTVVAAVAVQGSVAGESATLTLHESSTSQ